MPEMNRKKTLLVGAISNYGAIAISIIVGLISVPIGLHYFGPIRYGTWLVIGSILAYFRISDFGISLSTLTLMAQASKPVHQRVILRRSISLLLGIGVVFILLILGVSHLFPGWIGILGKIPSNFQREAATATIVASILVLFQLPTTVFTSAFSGLQQVHWSRAYGALRAIIALIALVVTILTGGNLVTLSIFTGLGSFLVGITSGFHLFLVHPNIRPRIGEKVVDAPSSRLLFASGVRFLILQISVLIIWNTDNLVISHCIAAEAVAPYGITFKFYQIGLTVVNAVTGVLWPMYGQASGRGDWDWIQRTYNRCASILVIAGGLIWIGGIIFSQAIINLWAGPAAYGGLVVAFALGGYVYISSFGGSNASLINGLNPTNVVVIFGLIEAALNLGISLALVGHLGIGGVALGTLIASLIINSWFGPLYIRHQTFEKVRLEIKPILTHAFIVISCVISALFTVLYIPPGWFRFVVGIAIIMVYLVLSWEVMPNLQILIKSAFFELRLVRGFFPIKERR